MRRTFTHCAPLGANKGGWALGSVHRTAESLVWEGPNTRHLGNPPRFGTRSLRPWPRGRTRAVRLTVPACPAGVAIKAEDLCRAVLPVVRGAPSITKRPRASRGRIMTKSFHSLKSTTHPTVTAAAWGLLQCIFPRPARFADSLHNPPPRLWCAQAVAVTELHSAAASHMAELPPNDAPLDTRGMSGGKAVAAPRP